MGTFGSTCTPVPESLRKHITDSFIPVEKRVENRGLDDVTQRQFDIRSNAYAGGIEHIEVEMGGGRFLNVAGNAGINTQIGNPTTNVLDSGAIANQANVVLPSSDPNSADVGDYLFYDFVVLTGLGAGQREKIISTNAGTRTITLENNLLRPLQTGDIYQIVPGVVISGDGVSASAFMDFSPL